MHPSLIKIDSLQAHLGSPGREWLRIALASSAPDRDAFLVAFAAAGRKLGTSPPEAGDQAGAGDAGPAWLLTAAPADEIGRVALLLRGAERFAPDAFVALVGECFRTGDNREKRSVLRSLALLPQPPRFVELAATACRTSVQTVFEGIACENPYPAAHFSEPQFNQMVLKSLFVGVALERIVGLDARITPELARMAADYASERRAAGRSVPADIGLLIGGSS